MNLQSRYDSSATEKKLREFWDNEGVYRFSRDSRKPIFAIDTPPPTVSGDLHLGHCYSYTHADLIARFMRMNGYNIYYPMGWDDNGLPTERLVEKKMGIKPDQVGREKFVEAITITSIEMEENYEHLWRRLALSVDWEYTYATIKPFARKISQYSFIDLYNKNLAYRSSSPTIWCPNCKTAIAQAEVDDLEFDTKFSTLAFRIKDGQTLPIATTRPELLAACVAVIVNPKDSRHQVIIGKTAITPLYKQEVPIIADDKADPEKGTGVVMCCTFGDSTDVEWWRIHKLPTKSIINRDGKLNNLAGPYDGLDVKAARKKILDDLSENGLLLDKKEITHTVRVHERCDTPVELIETKQWFIKILENKQRLLEAGKSIVWNPPFMKARYENWVEDLRWDWCISRQRYYGVPFPVWYCKNCGETNVAEISELPIDPTTTNPTKPCSCGSDDFTPELDVMDTWATSSVSPQIAGRWLEDQELFESVFPMTLRPQAHEIIRTWAFYTIVKSLYHFDQLPWTNIAISGWGILPEGGKISKSRGGGPIDPHDVMDRYSSDAVRYWASSTALGRDAAISEEKIATGKKLETKLWNVTKFAMQFIDGYQPPKRVQSLTLTDQWVLSSFQTLIRDATRNFNNYDYVPVKDGIETFFWNIFTDNYMEMVKKRLYELNDGDDKKESAKFVLFHVLLNITKLLAPFMPYITEEIFQQCFSTHELSKSIHTSNWPNELDKLNSVEAEEFGSILIGIATIVRRYKSASQLRLSEPLKILYLSTSDQNMQKKLRESNIDIKSVTRAEKIEISDAKIPDSILVEGQEGLWVAISY